MVNLMPGMNMSSAKGMARKMRKGDMTTVNLDLSGLPSDASNYYVYAVDSMGAVTLLGPAGCGRYGQSVYQGAQRRNGANQNAL